MDYALLLFVVHVAVCLFLTGLIWVIQLVHYPLFSKVGEKQFSAYEKSHQWRITTIVAPTMIFELASSMALIVYRPEFFGLFEAVMNFIGVSVLWLSTFLIHVPLHEKLGTRFNLRDHRWLVDSNWLRTIVWTLRSGCLVALVYTQLSVA